MSKLYIFCLVLSFVVTGFKSSAQGQKAPEYTDKDYEPLVNLSHKIQSDKGVFIKTITIPGQDKSGSKVVKPFKSDTFTITKTNKGNRFQYILSKGNEVFFIKKDSTFAYNLKNNNKLTLFNSGDVYSMLRVLYVIPTEFLELTTEQIDNMKMMHFIEIYYSKPEGVGFLVRAISTLKDRPYSIVYSLNLKSEELLGFESAVNGYNNGRYKCEKMGWAEDNKEDIVKDGLEAIKKGKFMVGDMNSLKPQVFKQTPKQNLKPAGRK